ncbi:MAG: type I-D CRISPR-associated protein Cas10d/Csc3 [Caldilineaceae bacterium]|nr:type I-D CRISPR-associated protein Cas10d/Csc3 [Caldilineaceae bacterium]
MSEGSVQASLFNESREPIDTELVDQYADQLERDEINETPSGLPSLAAEPLFSALLRRAVLRLWGEDPVLLDFVSMVAPQLSDRLGHVSAKGGQFAEQKRSEGADVSRYRFDQSMRAHLVNGLFPVLHIAHTLRRWGAPQLRYYDDTLRRVFIASYVLHDWLKLPEVDGQLEAAGLTHDKINMVEHRDEIERIFLDWGVQLGLDHFLSAVGGVKTLLHDLIYVACNTQIKWGTLRNLAVLPKLQLPSPQLDLAEQLSRLADYLAYVVRNPRQAAADRSLHREISTLSNQTAFLAYHHIADVRGVITNIVQNAALEAAQDDRRVPILYTPTGVVYLAAKDAPQLPEIGTVADNVVKRVQALARRRLEKSLTGFNRDGKGLKNAGYYDLFFDKLQLVELGISVAFERIYEGKGKKAVSGSRFEKMRSNAWMEPHVDLDLANDIRIDQMAEWCYFAEQTLRDLPGGQATARILLDAMGLNDLVTDFEAVPRDARAGGVGYHWYFAAGHYLKRNPGLDPATWRERVQQLAAALVAHFRALEETSHPGSERPVDDGFGDLRTYVKQILAFGTALPLTTAPVQGLDARAQSALFAAEFVRYSNAKKSGQGKSALCTLCSSPYAVDKQREAAILFAPQVYSNKMALHGSNAIRDICSICSLEMMLRQILMNRSNASGGRFEGRRVRYLYFYPTYFFTPETLELFRYVHDRLRRISFTELRKQLIVEDNGVPTLRIDDAGIWQRLEPLLMTPDDKFAPENDTYLRMHFPENEPVTFYFLGVPPPGRDSKDAEAWVHPAFLALVMPLCVDVKVVASEASLPVLNEAEELPETVFLDGAHAGINYLTTKARIKVDELKNVLKRLVTGYLVHLDANASVGGSGFDYRWQDLPALARRLDESPLYVFWYLKKWQRNGKLDVIPVAKARLYRRYYDSVDQGRNDKHMSHAHELTTLYRQFYRARRFNSNSILRPISVAANALLAADHRLFPDRESLVELVQGTLRDFVERVSKGSADGRLPQGIDRAAREKALEEFSHYFVEKLFLDTLKGDLSALRGKQLNLLKSACEVVYRDLDARDWANHTKETETEVPETNDDQDQSTAEELA